MSSELPKTMKAAMISEAGPPDVIHIENVPVPHVSRNHVIIALDYASVGSWDAHQRSGDWGAVKPGTVLGVDGSGTVAAIGEGVDHVRVGERVYSYSYENPNGGYYAEYVSVPGDRVARVPDAVSQEVAGAMPCVALTALSGLEALKVKRGTQVLVFGASGGVGSLAVWLAAVPMEATVTGAAREDAHEYVRRLGALHTIDPKSSEIEGALTRVAPARFDSLLATANGDDLPLLLAHLKNGAPFAFPNGVEPVPSAPGHQAFPYDGEMSRDAFERLNDAIGKHTIPLNVEVFAFDDVVAAHERIDRGHVDGKIVLRIR
jgi:NADPH:quinone reductase